MTKRAIKDKRNEKDGAIRIRAAALTCLTALTPVLEKETPLNYVQNANVRRAALTLLINPDNNLTGEINSAAANTPEALLLVVVSDWINRIEAALNQPETVVDDNLPNAPGFKFSSIEVWSI